MDFIQNFMTITTHARYCGTGSLLFLANNVFGFTTVQLGPHRTPRIMQSNEVTQSASDPGRT